jgi:hypothetical protein
MKKTFYLLLFFFFFISLLSGRGTYIEKNNLMTNEKPVLVKKIVRLEAEKKDLHKQLSKVTNRLQWKERRISWLKTNRGFARGVVFVVIFAGIGFVLYIISKVVLKIL